MKNTSSRVSLAFRLGLFLVIWFAALLGVLQSGPFLGHLGHGICGPWGCGPPTEALIVYHGFWLVLLGGPSLLALCYWQPSTLRSVGKVLVLLGLGVTAAITIWELVHLNANTRPLALQRIAFVLVTMVDIPLFQVTAAGALFWFAAGKKRHQGLPESKEETETKEEPEFSSASNN